jgi:hypothetical protein
MENQPRKKQKKQNCQKTIEINDYVKSVYTQFKNEKICIDENDKIFADHFNIVSATNNDTIKNIIDNVNSLCKIIKKQDEDILCNYAKIILSIFNEDCVDKINFMLRFLNFNPENFNYGDILIFENTLDEIILVINEVLHKMKTLEISNKNINILIIELNQDMLIIKKNLYKYYKLINFWKLLNNYDDVNNILNNIVNYDRIIMPIIIEYSELYKKKLKENNNKL